LGTHAVGPKQVGIALFGPYLLLVEVAALLLLAALVAAFHLGKRETDLSDPESSQLDASATASATDLEVQR
jgi:NADH-quinone oxidoreductase subunit J